MSVEPIFRRKRGEKKAPAPKEAPVVSGERRVVGMKVIPLIQRGKL